MKVRREKKGAKVFGTKQTYPFLLNYCYGNCAFHCIVWTFKLCLRILVNLFEVLRRILPHFSIL